MPEKRQPLFSNAYLRSVWAKDYNAFKNSPEAETLHSRLKNWAGKDWQKETASEASFIDLFFKQTWGYYASGESEKTHGYTIQQQFPVKGAGQRGNTGAADVAIGFFGRDDMAEIPQLLGEFKDDRSGLDKPQTSRPNARSPVDQCLDYLRESRTGLISPILPTWGFVTDMNEFRLYVYGNKAQYQRFVIKPEEGDLAVSLLGDGADSLFQRFLFYRTFHSEWLLTTGGKSRLEKLLGEQITHEQSLENEFYGEYHAFRETLYQALRQHNPQYEQEGRLRRLVKFTQRILDRCLFILYCEDMGRDLGFPPNVLRDALIEVGASKFYNPESDQAWNMLKRLFSAMREGSPFGAERINKFNGGLFVEDPEMDGLKIPNCVFCEQNQGQSTQRLLQYPKTLLYFSAKYNFGTAEDGAGRTLTLTAMGRIFEQSITDLEVMEAHAEGRESLTELTKRKRDGVYYTPEWVTHYIVEETVGARLSEIRKELGLDKFTNVTDEQIDAYRKDRRSSRLVGEYEKVLQQYRQRLDELRVVDPACGSGAFLIQAFKYLYEERQWIVKELERITGVMRLFDTHSAMRAVLSKNIYGTDINAESVEITRLALWLHTALPDQPLTSLDRNIRCGNSLIGHDFYSQRGINRELFDEDEQERVNTFDWKEAFPEIFEGEDPGFDCVIGNPPYVKLQHFRKIQEDVAEYLIKARAENGGPLYESTQTGNFDMYLPFIERGIELLNSKGKMGYIAPNVWMVNEYGKGLRQKLKRTRRLDRWIDFKSFQVFDEATTYTALQFFVGFPQDHIHCVFAPGGKQDIASVDWREVKDVTCYQDLSEKESWIFVSYIERSLFDKLKECDQLGDSSVTTQIFQGVKTSADKTYVLERVSPNSYLYKGGEKPEQVSIEDSLMRKIASGKRINRYESPIVDVYLLFPYDISKVRPTLYSQAEMKAKFPNAWAYLCQHENELRAREKHRFNDDNWYCFSRPQNLDKQPLPKLAVAGTTPELRLTCDKNGELSTLGGRVYSILPTVKSEMHFLLGILNSPVPNLIFVRIARPKAGGFFDAETQFLRPLPIPHATEDEKSQVAEKATILHELHTRRRDLLLMIDKRLESAQCEEDSRDEGWLWANVKPLNDLKNEAPAELKGAELSAWAKLQRNLKLAAHLEQINPLLRPGAKLTVKIDYGELALMADGITLIDGIFLEEEEAAFIAAQWRQKARRTNVTQKFDANRLISLLLKLRKTSNPAIMKQVVGIDADIEALDSEITHAEDDMNQLTYRLYKLTGEEIQMVERG